MIRIVVLRSQNLRNDNLSLLFANAIDVILVSKAILFIRNLLDENHTI